MLIVIPTYKRLESLPLVLRSLLKTKTQKINESIRVLIVNNYPPNASSIRSIVDSYDHDQRFEWSILYRKESLPPVKNWYSAVEERALDNEIVLFNSDDDLFLPWNLEYRYVSMLKSGADLSISKLGESIFFDEKGNILCNQSSLHSSNEEPRAYLNLNYSNFYSFQPQHLSNHCFRNSPQFRSALEKAQLWCNKQSWLDFNTRSLFVTLYIPLALLCIGGHSLGLPTACILRGKELQEIINAKFGIPSWNHGFIHLVALDVLNNEELSSIRELDLIRESYKKEFVRWFLTYAFDDRVGLSTLLESLKRTNFSLKELLSIEILSGIPLLLREVFKLKGLSLKRQFEKKGVTIDTFFEDYSGIQTSENDELLTE